MTAIATCPKCGRVLASLTGKELGTCRVCGHVSVRWLGGEHPTIAPTWIYLPKPKPRRQ